MPYEIVKRRRKWLVRNKITKRVLGTHSSESAAKAQLRAVYRATGGA